MRFIAVGFLILLVCSAASAREIMTNDGRVIHEPDKKSGLHREARPRKRVAHVHKFVEKRVVYPTSSLITEARRWLGSTARQMGLHRVTLWCATALDKWLRAVGLRGTGSDLALSYAHWGRPSACVPGAIAVLRRRGGGHVGVVTANAGHGKVRLISGNHGHRVREAMYSTGRIVACRVP